MAEIRTLLMERIEMIRQIPTDRHRRGFTLVELMVSLVIIAVLMSMLLPAILASRDAARGVECKNHLRQIGLAILNYTDQHDGVFPTYRWYDPGPTFSLQFNDETIEIDRPRWNLLIGPFIEGSIDTNVLDPNGDGIADFDDDFTPFGNKVFICPNSPERNNSRDSSYGYNYHFLGHARTLTPGAIREPPYINYPVHRSRMLNSAGTLMVADSLGTASGYPTSRREPYSFASKRCNSLGNHAYSLDPPIPWFRTVAGEIQLGNVGEMSCELGGSAPNAEFGFNAVDARHRGMANAVFADGHVASMTPEDLGYLVREDGSYAYNSLDELFTDANNNGVPEKNEWHASNKWFTGTGTNGLLPKPHPEYR